MSIGPPTTPILKISLIKNWRFWVYLFFIAIAAFVSQVAEWTHLKYADDWLLIYAILAAIGFACIEYFISVPTNRLGHGIGVNYSQLQVIWTSFQLIAHGLICYYYFNEFNTWSLVVYVFLFIAILISFFLTPKGEHSVNP